jgi:hypothetical protein
MPIPSLLSDKQFNGFTLRKFLQLLMSRVFSKDRIIPWEHSYFLSVSGDTDIGVSSLFTLQEYFYHDYQKKIIFWVPVLLKHGCSFKI